MRLFIYGVALCLAACQVVTKLDKFGVYEDPDASLRSGECVVPDGSDCNPVAQCGCAADEHCQALGDDVTPTCTKPGSRDAWSACEAASQCPRGQTCDRGSCRSYCAGDADCGAGSCVPAAGPDGRPTPGLHVCWKTCEIGDKSCANGTTCRAAKTPFGTTGHYCVAPFDPCPTVEDGVCDDPTGTKSCADGTDEKDCECKPKLSDAKCDPVAQCGCGVDSTCEAVVKGDASDQLVQLSARCSESGAGGSNEACERSADCQRGLFCHTSLKVCTKYCSATVGCEDGACQLIPNQDNVSIGACLTPCTRDGGKFCPDKSVCATFEAGAPNLVSEPGDYCVEPLTECRQDGVCDEPRGTGRCVAGSDTEDCCKPPTPDGACEPVWQCGCEEKPGTQCQHIDGSAKTMCQVVGKQQPGSVCSNEVGQCPPGYHCLLRVCRKYCNDSSDCGGNGNLCVPKADSKRQQLPGIGACYVACDYSNEGSCPSGTVCARTAPNVSFCWVPISPCPALQIGNGACDDTRPGGTRLCMLGTDPDCI